MQTFLPYPDFEQSAQTLDYRRLGKQRVETLQILNALHGLSRGWTNHPATLMWKDNVDWLVLYGLAMCEEWISRGYKDTCTDKIAKFYSKQTKFPDWINERLCSSHRAALLKKDFGYYSQFGWSEQPSINYIWR